MKRDIQKVSDDIVEIKRKIKQTLISDQDILEALHNPAIPLDSPDEFLDNNIYGFIRIPTTQDIVRNFICFTVDDIEPSYNSHMKVQQIQFVCICHLEDMKTQYGIDRHDLLGYLVRDVFNWSNEFGKQFKLVYNKESTIDSDYYCRTLKFERECTNSLNKATRSNLHDRS